MENNNLVITTANGFEIIRILNKLGMVDEIIDVIGEVQEIEKDKQRAFLKLRGLMIEKEPNFDSADEAERLVMIEKHAVETPEVKEALTESADLNKTSTKISTKLMLDAMMKLPQAEKEIYKVLASIFGIPEKEVQNNGLDWVIDAFKQIASSQTFQAFFKLAIK